MLVDMLCLQRMLISRIYRENLFRQVIKIIALKYFSNKVICLMKMKYKIICIHFLLVRCTNIQFIIGRMRHDWLKDQHTIVSQITKSLVLKHLINNFMIIVHEAHAGDVEY
jgi:hypothetical protein